MVPNDLVAGYVCQHPEKLAGFACLDPTEPDCLDEMHRVFEVLRLRGLKLAPLYQNYHPMDDRMQPVYAYCEAREIPVLIHQGTTFARRAPLQYARPMQLEFPLRHAGGLDRGAAEREPGRRQQRAAPGAGGGHPGDTGTRHI